MAASESNLFARASKVVYIASLNKYFWTRVGDVGGKWVLFKGLFTRREVYPGMRGTLTLTHFLFFSSLCLQGSQGYPGRWVTLFAC